MSNEAAGPPSGWDKPLDLPCSRDKDKPATYHPLLILHFHSLWPCTHEVKGFWTIEVGSSLPCFIAPDICLGIIRLFSFLFREAVMKKFLLFLSIVCWGKRLGDGGRRLPGFLSLGSRNGVRSGTIGYSFFTGPLLPFLLPFGHCGRSGD